MEAGTVCGGRCSARKCMVVNRKIDTPPAGLVLGLIAG